MTRERAGKTSIDVRRQQRQRIARFAFGANTANAHAPDPVMRACGLARDNAAMASATAGNFDRATASRSFLP